MGDWGGYNYGHRDPDVRNEILRHFQRRGVPQARWGEMLDRWIRSKGFRAPVTVSEKP